MQIKPLHLLFLATLILLSGTVSGVSLTEHTTDEWRSILAVPDNSTMLTGLQITLTVSPNTYYLPQGSEVNISGTISSIFGPIKNAQIILARGNATSPISYANLTSDESGDFSYTDLVNNSGVVRYQAWFEGSDLKGENLTKSYEVEINADASGQKITGPEPDEETDTSEESLDESADSEEAGNSSERQDVGSLFTLHGPESFVSGENITLSGSLTAYDQTPLPYTPVTIQKQDSDGEYSKIGDTVITGDDGIFTASYFMTGPSPLTFRAVTSGKQGEELASNTVTMQFERTDDFAPMSRDRTGTRNINADLNAVIIRPDENVTISGWFSDGNGDGIAAGRLNLYWYNFADRIWDRYRNCSETITNDDGFYAFNVSGPNLTGVSYLAVVSKKEQTGKPLFSHILPLVVKGQAENSSSVLPAQLTAKSDPAEVQVNEKAQITFTLSDPDGNPLADEPVKMYFSEDGFTWFMNGNENLTTRNDGTIAMVDVPKAPGFHYYRGVYSGSDFFGPADSGILALIITPSTNGTDQAPVLNTTTGQ